MWERGEKGGVGGRGVEVEREWKRAREEEGTGEDVGGMKGAEERGAEERASG